MSDANGEGQAHCGRILQQAGFNLVAIHQAVPQIVEFLSGQQPVSVRRHIVLCLIVICCTLLIQLEDMYLKMHLHTQAWLS